MTMPTSAGPAGSSSGVRPSQARWVLLALILLAFGLRLWRIEDKSIWWDESLSLYRAQHDVPYILSNRIDFPGASTTDQHPPLYFVLLHFFIRLAGESDLALRLPSVLWATLLVPLLYRLGARLWGRSIGLLAALWATLSPFYLWYAQEARMYTMLTALTVISFYAFWRAFTEQRRLWASLFGVTFIAALFTQYLYALLIPGLILLGFFLWPRRASHGMAHPVPSPHRSRRWLWLTILPLLLLPPLGYGVARLIPSLNSSRTYVPLGIILRDALNSFSLGLSVDLAEVWHWDALLAAIFVLGVLSLWREPPRLGGDGRAALWQARGAGFTLIVGLILLPIVFIWIFSFFTPLYMGSRYVIMCSPSFYLGLALGVRSLARKKPWPAWVAALLIIGAMGYSTQRYFTHPAYRAKADYRSAARHIALHERPGDVVIVDAPENLPAFLHYYAGDLPVVGVPTIALAGRADPDQVAATLTDLTAQYDRLWLVHCRTMFSDPENVVSQWLEEHTLLQERIPFPSYADDVRLSAHLARSPILAEAKETAEPRGILAERLLLLSCALRYLDATGQPQEIPLAGDAPRPSGPVPAGKTITALCHWRPLQPLGVYKTSLRLVDDQGVLWAQRDEAPFMYVPTSQWPVGAVIRHEATLPIPPVTPPGTYRLQLWVYEAENGRPLDFVARGGAPAQPYLDLGTIQVGRNLKRLTAQETIPQAAYRPWGGAVFGGDIALLASDWGPKSLKRGKPLTLHLYWRAQRSVQQDYALVLHWVDASGQVRHTSRHSLTGTDYATSLWTEGELLRGILILTAPGEIPPGEYKLSILLQPQGREDFLRLRRGPWPWAGHKLVVARVSVS
jgi:mannosyltransferase